MHKWIPILLAIGLLFCLTGCQKHEAAVANTDAPTSAHSINPDEYLFTVKEQADAIQTVLETEELTQADMNQKSMELADLWEGAMSTLLSEAQKSLSAADYEQLTAEQSTWETEKKAAVETAGKEFEGGSMHALVVNAEAAKLTEARVMVLMQMLKNTK